MFSSRMYRPPQSRPPMGKNMIRGLIARGCSDEDVRKIAGGNALGLFRRVMGSGEGASRITERECSLTKLERLGGCYARIIRCSAAAQALAAKRSRVRFPLRRQE